MGLKASDLAGDEPAETTLGNWHVNLLLIDRRKCVLFVNDRTLFNFIAVGVKKPQLRELGALFMMNLSRALLEEEISLDILNGILAEYKYLDYAATNSQSILGSLNDLAFHYKRYIQEAGGVASAPISNITQRLNRMPLKAQFPIDNLRNLYNIHD